MQSPRVGTPDYFYHYAANFHQAYFVGLTVKLSQLVRLLFGLFFVLLLAEELFVGPTDTISSVAYLSLWGILAAFVTMLFQYKSCNYELRKNSTPNGATIYAHGVLYKKLALQSLELAVALNAVIFWGFAGFILPNTEEAFRESSFDEAFGSSQAAQTWWWVRSVLKHLLPYIACLASCVITDVIFLETDWWLIPLTGLAYTFVNFMVCRYKGVNSVYFMDWTNHSDITAYSPFVDCVAFTIVALASHFFMCLATQILTAKYEFRFGSYSQDV